MRLTRTRSGEHLARRAVRFRGFRAFSIRNGTWPIRNVVFFLLAGGLCFTVGPLMRYCKEHRYFAVRRIEILGLDRLDASRVRAWMGMVEGGSIWQASPQVLEARLERQPAIASATVRRLLPDRLRVTVHERRPRAILRAEDRLFLVDQSGVVLDPATPADVAVLPIVSVDTARWRAAHPERAQPELPLPRELREAVRVAHLFETGLAGIRVSEVALVPGGERPEVVAFSEDGRLAMKLGWGGWRDKLDALRRVLAHAASSLSGDPGADPAEELAIGRLAGSVDLRDPTTVVARWVPTQGMI